MAAVLVSRKSAPYPTSRPLLRLLVALAALLTVPLGTSADTAETDTVIPEIEPVPEPQRLPSDAAAAEALITEPDAPAAEPLELLGAEIQPGTLKRSTWNATEAFSGTAIPTPVLIAHGAQAGPVLCLTAAVHGDELNGIETVRRIMYDLNPEALTGTVIGVPIVNLQGFQRHSRYLPDRRDLNRYFPGNPRGSSASRIAHAFFNQVLRHCDGVVDLHTGSFHRTNLPQIRADLNNESVVRLTEGFGSTIILHSEGGVGTLRRACVEAGIPAVTLEAGEPLRLGDTEVRHSVKGIYTLFETLGMYDKRGIRGNPEPVYFTSQWVRADTGGILFSKVKLGKRIRPDDLLGTVTDPISNEREEIRSPFAGRVIGMALNQFVMPGFATYHIGIEADDADEARTDEEPVILSHDVAYEPDPEAVE
ncbi:MAG: succinylglutamate desuccinylase/aspartoacylase family protein [Pseudomonadota bacterium]